MTRHNTMSCWSVCRVERMEFHYQTLRNATERCGWEKKSVRKEKRHMLNSNNMSMKYWFRPWNRKSMQLNIVELTTESAVCLLSVADVLVELGPLSCSFDLLHDTYSTWPSTFEQGKKELVWLQKGDLKMLRTNVRKRRIPVLCLSTFTFTWAQQLSDALSCAGDFIQNWFDAQGKPREVMAWNCNEHNTAVCHF